MFKKLGKCNNIKESIVPELHHKTQHKRKCLLIKAIPRGKDFLLFSRPKSKKTKINFKYTNSSRLLRNSEF